ncbi:MAG: hypothetical protein HXK29_05480 [Atopobium sp.]|nr:hypothetical protein [Atopobium sp.]
MAFIPMERRFYQFCVEAKVKYFAVNSKTLGIKKHVYVVTETEVAPRSLFPMSQLQCRFHADEQTSFSEI